MKGVRTKLFHRMFDMREALIGNEAVITPFWNLDEAVIHAVVAVLP